jgi:hypothetical protein
MSVCGVWIKGKKQDTGNRSTQHIRRSAGRAHQVDLRSVKPENTPGIMICRHERDTLLSLLA